MARIGYGYGSEWHLLRWLGRHRHELDRRILDLLGSPDSSIDWLDAPFKRGDWPDDEHEGLDFLQDRPDLLEMWRNFWPSTGRAQTWDAVAWITTEPGAPELLLFEAKAHVAELASNCTAREEGGRPRIRESLQRVQTALGVREGPDWLVGYYQHANRIAAMQFLRENGLPTHLIFVYFTGDRSDSRRNCPQVEADWADALAAQDEHLAIPKEHSYSRYVHKLFLPVASADAKGVHRI